MKTPKEVDACWVWLKKFASEPDRVRFRPVHAFVTKLQKRVRDLEEELTRVRQQSLEGVRGPSMQSMQIGIPNPASTYRPLPPVHAPLAQRLSELEHKGLRGSDEWERNLRWNSVREDEADELIKEYRREKNER